MNWEELPFKERAEYIKVGVKNGFNGLEEIKNAYHSYAEGGPLDGEELEVEGNKFEDGGPKSITDKVKLGLAELDESVFGTLLEKVRDIRNGRFLSNLGESSKNKVFGKRGDNGGTAQRTYLLPRWEQELIFQRDGYIKGKDRDYGLVNKAVGDRNLPVYQTAPDAISRENLVPIGNDSFNSDNFGNSYGLNRNTQLYHAGNYPISVYIDTNLDKVYYKGWDLNDYGGTTGPLDYALDAVGSPVVVTTGYQPLQWLNPKKTNKGTYTDDFGNTYPLIEYSDKEGTYNDISIQDLLNPKPNQSNYYYSRIEDVREHVLPMLDAAMKKRGLVRTNIGNAENPEEQYTLPEFTVTAKGKKK